VQHVVSSTPSASRRQRWQTSAEVVGSVGVPPALVADHEQQVVERGPLDRGDQVGTRPSSGESERTAGRVGYCDDDEEDHGVVSFAEPISLGYVLIQRDYLADVTSLEHERWKRAHPGFCRQMGIR
jgi:hypothetical protein